MATVLEEYATEEQSSVVHFCGQKDSMQRIFIKIFPVYGGKCLSHKAVHNWVNKFSQGRSKVVDVTRPGHPVAQVAKTTVKRLLCCGFQRTSKAIGQVYQCWWRICRETNVLPVSKITCFKLYIHLWPIYCLSLICRIWRSHRRSYADFYRLGYNAVCSAKSQPTFRRNISSPSSWLKSKPSKKKHASNKALINLLNILARFFWNWQILKSN
jgi:hypothetical protein